MTKKLVSFDDQAEPGEGLPTAVRSELNATYAPVGDPQKPLVGLSTSQSRPMMVFIDDDGRKSTFDRIRPLFAARGVPFVAAVSTGLIDLPEPSNFMTLAQLRQLHSEGVEIASHLVEHVRGWGAPGQIGESFQWLRDEGLDPKSLVWPYGSYDHATITEAKKCFSCAVSVDRGANYPPVNQFALTRWAVGSAWTGQSMAGIVEDGSAAQYTAMVDRAVEHRCLVMAMMHSWDPQHDEEQQTRIGDMLDYALSEGVEIVTLPEAMAVFGNLLDIGSEQDRFIRVGANGRITSSEPELAPPKQGSVALGINPEGISNSTPGTDFPEGVTSTATFSLGNSTGFPVSNAGTLETIFPYDKDTIRQWWYPYNTSDVWFRAFSGGTESWLPWRSVNTHGVTSIVVPPQVVPAGQVVEYTAPNPDPGEADGNSALIVGSPVGGLPAGIMHSIAAWQDHTVAIRFHNTLTYEVAVASHTWRVSVTS